MDLAIQLISIRQRAYMTQVEFAEALGVSSMTINRWETAKVRPNITAMKKLRKFCYEHDIEYSPVEEAWIQSKVKEVENGKV